MQELTLGPYKARWVDRRGQDICRLPPETMVAELQDAQSTLSFFLADTGAGWRAVWKPEHIALLEEAQKVLPLALDVLQATQEAVAPCPYDRAYDLGTLITRGEALLRQTRRRLEQAPTLLNHAKARRELDAWKREQPDIRLASREQWCREKPETAVYHASEDETGETTFFFCDGSEVVRPTGPREPPRVTAGPVKRKHKDSVYLGAAAAYPTADILRAPRLPPPPGEDFEL